MIKIRLAALLFDYAFTFGQHMPHRKLKMRGPTYLDSVMVIVTPAITTVAVRGAPVVLVAAS